MSKRKMCEYWASGIKLRMNRKLCRMGEQICPGDTNARCEIVPRKAKPKYKRVKAWAVVTDDGVPYYAHTHRHSDSLCGFNVVPCFISVEAKWLKGSKG